MILNFESMLYVALGSTKQGWKYQYSRIYQYFDFTDISVDILEKKYW